MRLRLASILLPLAAAYAGDAPPLGGPEWHKDLEARVDRAFADLGADDFETREDAGQMLLVLSDACLPRLMRVAQTPDQPEPATRARGILERRDAILSLVDEKLAEFLSGADGRGSPIDIPEGYLDFALVSKPALRAFDIGTRFTWLEGALAQVDKAVLLDALVLRSEDPSTPVRAGACLVLGVLGVPEAVPLLRERLRDRREEVRVAAARGLLRGADPSLGDLLLDGKALGVGDVSVNGAWSWIQGDRLAWLQRVAKRHGFAACARLVEGKGEVARAISWRDAPNPLSEEDAHVAERVAAGELDFGNPQDALDALVRRTGGDPADRLRVYLAHPSDQVRWEALICAENSCLIPDEEIIRAAGGLLGAHDKYGRSTAIHVLSRLGGLRDVLDRVSRDSPEEVRSVIGYIAAQPFDPALADLLAPLLDAMAPGDLVSMIDRSPSTYQSVLPVGFVGWEGAFDAFWRDAFPEGRQVNTTLLWVVPDFRVPSARTRLEILFGHPDPRVRVTALSAWVKCGGRPVPPMGRELLHDPDPRVQHAAIRACVEASDSAAIAEAGAELLVDEVTRSFALEAIRGLRVQPCLDAVEDLFSERDPKWRDQLLVTLAALGARGHLEEMKAHYVSTQHGWTDGLPRCAYEVGGAAEIAAWLEAVRPEGELDTYARSKVATLCALLGEEGLARARELLGAAAWKEMICQTIRAPAASTAQTWLAFWPESAKEQAWSGDDYWRKIGASGDAAVWEKVLGDARGEKRMAPLAVLQVLEAFPSRDGLTAALDLLREDPDRWGEAFWCAYRDRSDPGMTAAVQVCLERLPRERWQLVCYLMGEWRHPTREALGLLRETDPATANDERRLARKWRARVR